MSHFGANKTEVQTGGNGREGINDRLSSSGKSQSDVELPYTIRDRNCLASRNFANGR